MVALSFRFPCNLCILFLLIFPIGFAVPSVGADKHRQQSLWRGFFQRILLDLPQEERSADTFALFAELDEVDTVLTDRMGTVVTAPPSPAHPAFQKYYLDKNSAEVPNNRTEEGSKGGTQNCPSESGGDEKQRSKKPWQRLRSLFARVRLLRQTDRVVKAYQRLLQEDSAGGWGQLVRKMYAEMVVAKRTGVADGKVLRDNCRQALQLLQQPPPTMEDAEGRAEHGGEGAAQRRIDVAQIEPFPDLWSLVKSSAQTLLALFKGPFRTATNVVEGGKSGGGGGTSAGTTEQFVRVLKTFAAEDDDGGATFFSSIVRKSGQTEGKVKRQRRRKRFFSFLVIFGLCLVVLYTFAFLSELFNAFG